MIDVEDIKARFNIFRALLSELDDLTPFVVFSDKDHKGSGDNHTLFLQDSDYEYWEIYQAEKDLENNDDE